jgi:preprotein translocase subunit YajC
MAAGFHKDQHVTFIRSHDRVHSIAGTVVEVKDSEILVATEPDGVKVWANAADVTAVPEKASKKAS